jgi:anti-anti-sigma regulatory factor
MLRITVQTEPKQTVLKLSGRVAGAWVAELERTWQAATSTTAQKKKPLVVDLNDVAFVDARGRVLLRVMFLQGAELIGEGPLTGAIVDEITGHARHAEERI